MLPSHLQSLIEELLKFPGVGPKTAQRYVFYLLTQPKKYLEILGEKIKNLSKQIKTCSVCFNFSDMDPCAICSNKNRNHSILCVVATPQDLNIIESTGEFKGVYHVLGGVLNPLEGITADKLKIKELQKRIESGKIKEIILALNPDMQGETTILYLNKILKSSFSRLNPPQSSLKIRGEEGGLEKGEERKGISDTIEITRLARGLPVGGTVEYADEVTLSDALKNRKEI